MGLRKENISLETRMTVKQSKNKWLQLVFGLLNSLTGDDTASKQLTPCIPPEWQKDDNTDTLSAGIQKAVDSQLGSRKKAKKAMMLLQTGTSTQTTQSGLESILAFVTKISGFVCKFKSQLQPLFKAKRVFLTKSEKSIFDTVSKAVHTVAKDVSSAVKGITMIADWASKSFSELTSMSTGVISQGKKIYGAVKSTVSTLVTGDFVGKFSTMKTCLETAKGDVAKVQAAVKDAAVKLESLTAEGMAGLGNAFLGMICNSKVFTSAIQSLMDALKSTDVLDKYTKFGQFIGSMLKAITEANRRKKF